MQTTFWVAFLCTQHAFISLAAPPPSADAISTPTQSPSSSSPALNATASSSSPYYGYFRTIVGNIQADLPPFLSNAPLATKFPNATLSIPSITASLPPASTFTQIDIADYPLNAPHRTYNHTVPHTLTKLILHLANPGQVPPIPATAYAKTLLSLHRTLSAELNTTGDRWLSPSEDPFGWDLELGCLLEFWSNPEKGVSPLPGDAGRMEKQHLTLGILHSVVEGLLQRLVYKGLYEFVYVEVFDSGWGLVGMGFVSPYAVGGNGTTDEVGSVLATLQIEGKR